MARTDKRGYVKLTIVGLLGLLFAYGVVSSYALAQNTGSLTVTLHERFTKRGIINNVIRNIHRKPFSLFSGRAKIKGVIKCKDSGCQPSSYTRFSQGGLRAHYKFKGELENLPDIGVDLDIVIVFRCWSLDPALRSNVQVRNVEVDLNNLVEIALPGIAIFIEDYLSFKVSQMTTSYVAAINSQINNSDLALPFCPNFATSSAGDLTLNFTQGTQCTAGQTRTQECGDNYFGTGKQWVCENGWWRLVRNDCTRIPSGDRVIP